MGDFPLAETYADEALSLPIYTGMTAKEQEYVIDKINRWSKGDVRHVHGKGR